MKKLITVLFLSIILNKTNAQFGNDPDFLQTPQFTWIDSFTLKVSFNLVSQKNIPIVVTSQVYLGKDAPPFLPMELEKKDTFLEKNGTKEIFLEGLNSQGESHFTISLLTGYIDSSYGGTSYNVAAYDPTGISDFKALEITAYPNPTSNMMTIIALESGIVFIYDITGKRVLGAPVTQGENILNVAFLEKGSYIIELNSSQTNGNSYPSIILKE